jgi:competence protein ComGC
MWIGIIGSDLNSKKSRRIHFWILTLCLITFILVKLRFSNQRNHALTLIEVLVIICIIALLAVIFVHIFSAIKQKASRVNCVNNLKRIGVAYRVWEGNHNDKYPMQVSVTYGGVKELTLSGDASAIFRVMSNEFATPKI